MATCPYCAEPINQSANVCPHCQSDLRAERRPARRQNPGDDAGMRMLLPVGRSGWAIAAGYLGLISVLMFPAPFAILCAVLAIRDIRKNPEKHGMGRAIFGLVMGVLGAVGLVFLIAGMAFFDR